jgi:plastocyanin
MIPTRILALLAIPFVAAQYGDSGSSSTSSASSATSAAPATVASESGVHQVQVGAGGKFVFLPDSVTAKAGEKVRFIFNPIAHGVVQAAFDNPCQPINDSAINSGIMSVSSGIGKMTFDVTINGTDPVWIYCPQTELSHCQSGMVMVINPP